MRLVKMFGLAVIAAVAAMAFVGASSAMANGETALCEVNELKCPAGSVYEGGTAVNARLLNQTAELAKNLTNVSPSLLLNGSGGTEVKCWESLATGEITTTDGLENPLKGKINSLSFGHCEHKTGASCEVRITKLGTLTLLKTAVNLGHALETGVLAEVECKTLGGLVEFRCSYSTESLPMHARGTQETGPAELTANKAKLIHEKNALTDVACPAEGLFDATYEIYQPAEGYITE